MPNFRTPELLGVTLGRKIVQILLLTKYLRSAGRYTVLKIRNACSLEAAAMTKLTETFRNYSVV